MAIRERRAVTQAPEDPQPIRILRELSGSPEGMTAPQLFDALYEGTRPRLHVLSWYSDILRTHRQGGRVERVGATAGGWQRPPSPIWAITQAGREAIAAHDAIPESRRGADADAAERRQRGAERARRRDEALAAAFGQYGPGAAAAVRRSAAPGLQAAGCSLREIASVFGVSAEMIRQDLLKGADYVPRRPAGGSSYLSARRRALDRLAEAHHEHFGVLLAEEMR